MNRIYKKKQCLEVGEKKLLVVKVDKKKEGISKEGGKKRREV